ncbi:probable cysteine protease RDL6 [Cicer arietinum]|uniref:Probable cysteine protease RDL6 n=1 Tax=Cicer arietinum TaxID=3827 RepID=A0A3Q7XH81_CICAR|nr:probable cysteine protease RDL6 [Cicer arietinum]
MCSLLVIVVVFSVVDGSYIQEHGRFDGSHDLEVLNASLSRTRYLCGDIVHSYGCAIPLNPIELFNLDILTLLPSMNGSYNEIPANVDWRLKGGVTNIQNQRDCGCCWAFSTVAAVEGILKISRGDPLMSLSQQELVDCDHVNKGCKNGHISAAFEYIIRNEGLVKGKDYPYKAVWQDNLSQLFWVSLPNQFFYSIIIKE